MSRVLVEGDLGRSNKLAHIVIEHLLPEISSGTVLIETPLPPGGCS